MKNSIDQIYESSVFGKPSIHLDPLEAAPTSGQKKTSERDQVINSYLPERFHTKKSPINNPSSKKTGTSLNEKYKANASPDIEKQFINLLESYFSSNRHAHLGNLEEVMEDMYSFLKESQ
jgi:hypothetical protein